MADEEGREETKLVVSPAATGTSGSRAPLRLVVMGEGAPKTLPLPAQGELIVGRAAESAVRIDHASVSRKHATLRIGDTVEVVDLGSANGTKVGGRKLVAGEVAVVAPGDVLTFGSTTAIIQIGSLGTRVRRIVDHGYLELRVEEECARAASAVDEEPRMFAVMRLRFAKSQRAALEESFGQWLRPADIVASYAPNEYEFLLLDTSQSAVDELAGRVRGAFADVVVGVAVYPADGTSAARLLSAAATSPAPKATDDSEPQTFEGEAMARLRPLVERVAVGNISVLVLGETGVGKEVMAHRIHALSPRASKPFLSLNCAAFAETLLESELFGHERGAFTGADKSKQGLLESADGGTVFLDEVGEMPLSVQAKLLRVLEQRQVYRLGSLKPKDIDVRFVAATNRDLELEIQRGSFRQDLFFRLNGVAIVVPALRERVSEILPLARLFATQFSKQLGRRRPEFAKASIELMNEYAWPGNVRELRNVVERAMLLCEGDLVMPEHLPREKMGRTVVEHQPRRGALREAPPPPPSSRNFADRETDGRLPTVGDSGSSDERDRILRALEQCAGNQTHAAKMLGMARGTLIARLEQFGIARPRKPR